MRCNAESLAAAEVALGSGAMRAAGLWRERECRQRRYQHRYPAISLRF